MSFSVPEFYEAFSSAPRPGSEEITMHRCCECDKVRDDFSEYLVTDVPDSIMEYHQDSIPLLTKMAFRYYLPRYVKYTCDYPNCNATDDLLFNLSPDDPKSEFWDGRCDKFSSSESGAIISYLEHRKTWPDAEFDIEHIQAGISFWGKK